MNFLAHCALGDRTDALIVGGFLGDFLKGTVSLGVPEGVRLGIRLHRRLDAFSGTHPDVRASVARLPGGLRRFAPPFVDLLADHFLAADFDALHGTRLSFFSARVYDAIDTHAEWLPPRALRFFEYMRSADLFEQYRDFAAVEHAFERIMARIGRRDVVAPMLAGARADLDALRRDFTAYYPALRIHSDDWLARQPAHRPADGQR